VSEAIPPEHLTPTRTCNEEIASSLRSSNDGKGGTRNDVKEKTRNDGKRRKIIKFSKVSLLKYLQNFKRKINIILQNCSLHLK